MVRGKSTELKNKTLLESLFVTILPKITPTKEEMEQVIYSSNEIMGRLRKAVPKGVEIILAGSTARGTQLRGSSDIDIFLLFPKDMEERTMEAKALSIAKTIVDKRKNERYIIKYAEHPYMRLILDDINIKADIVPAFKIKKSSDRGTAVDRTQLHNKFVNSHLSLRQKNDTRLLKYLLRCHGIYGAEAKIEGFSGYLCELLIYHYGSLPKLIESVANLNLPLGIDAAKRVTYQKSTKECISLGKKFGSRFIVLDPVDKNRNVAANLSEESLAKLAFLCRELAKKPTLETIYGKKFSDVNSSSKLAALCKKADASMYAISFKIADVAEDITWQQTKRLRLRMHKVLDDAGFKVALSLQGLTETEGTIGFMLLNDEVKSTIAEGPSIFMRQASEAFIKSHLKRGTIFIDSGRFYSIEKPKFVNAYSLISSFKNRALLPSHIRLDNFVVLKGKLPEGIAKLLYKAYLAKILQNSHF
jgi:tRNA nucleotidyltransferase (CCA-adding enzyme)